MDTVMLAGEVALTVIGLGGFELGPEAGTEPDVDRAVRVLEASYGAGICWVDTSESYDDTANESLIGTALQRLGHPFTIATKVAPDAGVTGGGSGFRPEEIRAGCERSLRRLHRDHLDVYFLHWPDRSGVPLDDTWEAMAGLVDAGLVAAIGMSNYPLADIARCHEQRRVDVVQTGLSLIDYLDDRPLIAGCGELGIPVTIYEPLAGGILSGIALGDIRSRWALWQDEGFYKRLLAGSNGERSIAVTDGLRPIAGRRGATVAQVAIAWVLRQPGVSAAIVGSRDGSHVEENAAAAALDLAAEDAAIEALIPLGPSFAA